MWKPKLSLVGRTLSLAIILSLLGAMGQAHALVIGTASNANSFPFTRTVLVTGGTRYQQVYAASNFSGPINISNVTFFASEIPTSIFQTADYTLTFSTSNFTVNNLNTTNLSANPGLDASLFASLNLSGPTGAQFSITAGTGGGTLFPYDPLLGDLLLDIVRSNLVGVTGSGGLDEEQSTIIFSRAHDFDSGFLSRGLVTGFNILNIPEPSTFAIFGFGLAGLGFMRRRRTA